MVKLYVFLSLFLIFSAYSAVVYTTGTTGPAVAPCKKATEGKMLFQKYNCTACHQLYGLGGYLGPELTTTISQPGKGELFARAILKTGTQRMPDFKLRDEEIDAFIEFLKYVDATAITYKTKN
ncbi:MAG: cytochrome c [Bacteroidetes bacterium]|nr:cytochrome c [Bacteroidota bacterium]